MVFAKVPSAMKVSKKSYFPVLSSFLTATFAPEFARSSRASAILINKTSVAPSPSSELPVHNHSLFEIWSKNLHRGDRVLWVLESQNERFLIEETLSTSQNPKMVKIFRTPKDNPVESTIETSLETVLVVKPDEQKIWSYWLHKTLDSMESETLALGHDPLEHDSLNLKAALHLPPIEEMPNGRDWPEHVSAELMLTRPRL